MPAQLKIIEKRAFNTCEKLEQVKIPPSVTYIGNSAFNMDRNLLLASLPDSLTEIGEWAFGIAIKSLYLPYRNLS